MMRDDGGDVITVEPLFYPGRGITASDAVFTIIWHGFSMPMQLYYTGDRHWWQAGTAVYSADQSNFGNILVSLIGDSSQYCNRLEFLY